MNRTADSIRDVDLASYLRAHEIRPSHQRLEILGYLVRSEEHPTVHRIYDDLLPRNPTLSKTTVYNTLRTLVERQLVEEITIEGSEARYDLHDPTHGHFKCERCGRLFDVPYELDRVRAHLPEGFLANEIRLYVNGICAECGRRG
ncbi:MAG: Fur family transcriptional regulator [Spirochaetota bacterium]